MIALHTTVTKHCNLLTDIEVARKAGFDGIEITNDKLFGFFDAGYTGEDVSNALDGLSVCGLGFLLNVERQNEDYQSLIDDAHKFFSAAKSIESPAVQILTGPVDVLAVREYQKGNKSSRYSGLLGMDDSEQKRLTAKNAAVLADMAKEYGLILYLEALAWTPVNSIAKSLEILDMAERDNLKIVIDYWHGYIAGDTPEQISKIDKKDIYCVHVCDSLAYKGGIPDEVILRNVETGKGVIPMKEWTDAIKSTGFDGFWSCESFCKAQQELKPLDSAISLKNYMTNLIMDK